MVNLIGNIACCAKEILRSNAGNSYCEKVMEQSFNPIYYFFRAIPCDKISAPNHKLQLRQIKSVDIGKQLW